MDFNAFNPQSSNSLNIAARKNQSQLLKKLLMKLNPNCVDNRGWSCLHEAAANDSYESLLLILKHEDCRHYIETFEGHTALYLACKQKCSLKTIKLLLDTIPDIANYGNTEMVTPLHVASYDARLEVVELLIKYGAILDVQDFNGDTPLHDAILRQNHEVVSLLLHAGANPNIKNENGLTPFLLACLGDSLPLLQSVHSFIQVDINDVNIVNEHCLTLAARAGNAEIVEYLLREGADPNLRNKDNDLPLRVAFLHNSHECFRTLLKVTDRNKIHEYIVKEACSIDNFNIDTVIALLESDLEQKFFYLNVEFKYSITVGTEKLSYTKLSPLNIFIESAEHIYTEYREYFEKIFYLFLMKGMSVNAICKEECPPIVFILLVEHTKCFEDVLRILIDHKADLDLKTRSIPDVFIVSLVAQGGRNIRSCLRYSLDCEPLQLLCFAHNNSNLVRVPNEVKCELLSIVDPHIDFVDDNFDVTKMLPPLKHLARVAIRENFRKDGRRFHEFVQTLDILPLPDSIKDYLRYL